MKRKSPVVDYRNLRPGNLNSKEFRHLYLLLFWPAFGLLFLFVERFYQVDSYYPVHCFLDDYIPFCEWFVFAYLFWFVYLVGMLLYTLLYDIDGFRAMMKFVMVTYTTAIVTYLIFPTCQNLRPVEFARDNFMTRFMAGFYQFDTNTNVCPSIHVMGALAVLCTAWHCKGFQHPGWKWAFGVSALLICLSTVFLKQHSVVDVIMALPACLLADRLCFRRKQPDKAALAWDAASK